MPVLRRFKGFNTFYKGFEHFKSPVDAQFLKRKKKHFFVGLLLFCVLIINLFVWQMYRTIKGPFFAMMEESQRKYGETTNLSGEVDIGQLQTLDTDADGLNDYDEMYQYGTSAYLADTDSDSVDDRAEIEQGSDPNCPTGETCASSAPSTEQAFAKQPTPFQQDAAQSLRQALLQSGMTEEELNQVSDEELLVFYQQFLLESNKQVNSGGAGDSMPIPEEEQLEYLKQMTPEQLRRFLVAAGADQSLIDAVPDDELLEMYLEALNAAQEEMPSEDVEAGLEDESTLDEDTVENFEGEDGSAVEDFQMEDSKEEVLEDWQEALEE